jgi:hypothetical protein
MRKVEISNNFGQIGLMYVLGIKNSGNKEPNKEGMKKHKVFCHCSSINWTSGRRRIGLILVQCMSGSEIFMTLF